jgi:hypothetical protein
MTPAGPPDRHGEGRANGLSQEPAGFSGSSIDERTLVDLLVRLNPATGPTTAERDRMRARVLAGIAVEQVPVRTVDRPVRSARVLAPPDNRGPRGRRRPGARPLSDRSDTTRPGDPPPGRPGGGARARFAVAAVAVLALVFSLAGMSLLLARDAIPGEALYGLKRTAEAASLGLTFGDESKALKHLELATARISEIETLAARYQDPSSAPIGGYLAALGDFDRDATAGSRQLIALATRDDGRMLAALRGWAEQQTGRLDTVSPQLPLDSAERANASISLLNRIAARSAALFARMPCYQITSGLADDVGSLPATSACDVPPPGSPDAGSSDPRATASVPPGGRSGVQPTGALPPGATDPSGQPLPPGTSVTVPPILGGPTTNPTSPGDVPPSTGAPTITVPLPLPVIELPPLLPGLPGIVIGGG